MANVPTNDDDVIFGTSAGETIDALLGNDTVFGANGFDTLLGNGGNDVLSGGSGRDTLNGGKGFDTADYSFAFGDVLASLTDGFGYLVSAGPRADKDTYISIENLTGGFGGDELEGNGSRNTLTGNDGNDTLDGMAGNDTLLGGDGADNLIGGSGDDVVDGGDDGDFIFDTGGADTNKGGGGVDVLHYLQSDAAVTVDLATGEAKGGHAEGDTNTSIESLVGSAFEDILRGNSKDNDLAGRGGGDVLVGRNGSDELFGFDGSDTLKGGGGFDQLYGSEGQDNLTGGAGIDHFSYTSIDDSVPFMPEADVITDFTQGEDKIDVHLIDAKPEAVGDDAFIFRGTQQYLPGVAGQIRFNFSGGITVVSFQTDVIGTDMFIVLDDSVDLTADDFVL